MGCRCTLLCCKANFLQDCSWEQGEKLSSGGAEGAQLFLQHDLSCVATPHASLWALFAGPGAVRGQQSRCPGRIKRLGVCPGGSGSLCPEQPCPRVGAVWGKRCFMTSSLCCSTALAKSLRAVEGLGRGSPAELAVPCAGCAQGSDLGLLPKRGCHPKSQLHLQKPTRSLLRWKTAAQPVAQVGQLAFPPLSCGTVLVQCHVLALWLQREAPRPKARGCAGVPLHQSALGTSWCSCGLLCKGPVSGLWGCSCTVVHAWPYLDVCTLPVLAAAAGAPCSNVMVFAQPWHRSHALLAISRVAAWSCQLSAGDFSQAPGSSGKMQCSHRGTRRRHSAAAAAIAHPGHGFPLLEGKGTASAAAESCALWHGSGLEPG